MNGEAHWITMVPVLLGGAGLAWLFIGDWMAERRYRTEKRKLSCPLESGEVEVTLVRDADSGAAVGLRSCSAFLDPETVACDKPCVARIGKLHLKPA